MTGPATGVAARAVIVLAGVALLVALPALFRLPALLVVLGTVAAVLLPARVGAGVATAGFVFGWLAATGFGEPPAIGRTVLGAAALWILQLATAIAAFVPARTSLPAAVLLGLLRRSLVPLAVAAAFVAVDLSLERGSAAVGVEVVGLVGVLALVVAAVLVVRGRRAA